MRSLSSDSWSDLNVSPKGTSTEITNAELGLAEDHFSRPEVGATAAPCVVCVCPLYSPE